MADISSITQFSGIAITSDQITGSTNKNATFAVPSLTTAQKNALENVTPYTVGANNNVRIKPGTIVYDITLNALQIFRNGVWENTSTSATTATGAGLVTGTPLILPSGTSALVEVAGNAVNGFIYYNTTAGNVRAYITAGGAGWKTVTIA